jgi:hypothetical protein
MKHKDAQAFVRKYNTELAIKGYSKMKKADLFSLIDSKLKHNRIELQREWSVLKGDAAPVKRPPSAAEARGAAAGARARAGAGQTKPSVKRPAAKRPVAAKRRVALQPVKVAAKKPAVYFDAKKAVPRAFSRKSQNAADDAWHARNKDTSGQAQTNRLNAVVDRLTRRAAIQRDKERVRRIRGRKIKYV